MDNALIALKLFLEELGINEEIRTLDDRKRVQKAVYLGQLSGVDLGYRFSWYKLGPYCPGLTRDYYNLAEAVESGENDYKNKELKSSLKRKLAGIKPIMTPPDNVSLPQEDWLELVASLHYLLKVARYPEAMAINELNEKKPHLVRHINKAKSILTTNGLL